MTFEQVVIIGGGVAGLAAAAAVAPYCNAVMLFDKDDLSGGVCVRKAIPQGAHIHILLRSGLDILNELLPDFSNELEARGSVRIYTGSDQQIFECGKWQPVRKLDLYFLSQSRPFLEAALRERVRAITNVTISDKTSVKNIDYQADNEGARITGLTLDSGEFVRADLVIDAAGAGGPFVRQLGKELGSFVETDTFKTDIFYSTVHFRKPQQWVGQQENILIVPEPIHDTLGGSLISVEGERWCVSLHGRAKQTVPETMADWLAATRSMGDDRIWQRIEHAQPETDVKVFKKPLSTWRRFDKATASPIGYLPVGDTITSFNPIYGQGMSVGLGHVSALRKALSDANNQSFDGLFRAYIDQACQWSAHAWRRATSVDAQFHGEQAIIGKKWDIARRLTLAQHQKAEQDPAFHLHLARQAQMLL